MVPSDLFRCGHVTRTVSKSSEIAVLKLRLCEPFSQRTARAEWPHTGPVPRSREWWSDTRVIVFPGRAMLWSTMGKAEADSVLDNTIQLLGHLTSSNIGSGGSVPPVFADLRISSL